jgi:hypothetical protein
MWSIVRIIVFLLIVSLHFPSIACDTVVRAEKKPQSLRTTGPDGGRQLTFQDRLLWRSVLGWCDECEERATPPPEYFDKDYGHVFILPLTDTEYIVDVFCARAAYQSEHLYYKVKEHADTIEIRLLRLEQFHFIPDPNDDASSRAKMSTRRSRKRENSSGSPILWSGERPGLTRRTNSSSWKTGM